MRTTVLTAALLVTAAAPLFAQQHQHHQHEERRDHQHHAEHLPAGQFPDGWNVRVDRDQPASEIMFHAMDDHFHARTGPAAVFYRDDWKHSGDYAVSARFRQNRAPQHPEAYGLVIGGRDLADAGQTYSYFLVRGTGEYFIANRDGADRNIVTGWTRHDAIRPQDADSGVQINVLGVRLEGDQAVFTVNGTEVERRPRADLHTDGVAGFRVNHRLDVRIDELQR